MLAYLGLPLGSINGVNGTKTSNETMLWMGVFPPSVPMKRVWDTRDREGGGVVCYRYEG